MSSGPDLWLRTLASAGSAPPRIRLVCFPHAGGASNYFRPWAALMPGGVELLAVRYPGREERFGDPLPASLPELADRIAEHCEPLRDAPLVLFGHSMGASVAYETAARLEAGPGPGPAALFVSGCAGPGRETVRDMAEADDERLVESIVRLGGTSAEVLGHRDLRALLLPTIRADYRLIEGYRRDQALWRGEVLGCPITAYYGSREPDVDGDKAAAWAPMTRAAFAARVFEGGHFFLAEHAAAIVEDVFARLGLALPGAPASPVVRPGTPEPVL